MKKAFRLLLTAVMLCSMLVVFTMPALAAPKQGVGVIDITADKDFSSTLKNLEDNRTIVLNLKKDICVDHEIVIEASNCSILIRVDDTYYSKYGDAKIYPNYNDDDYRFLNIEGNNVKLYFDGHVICRDFNKKSEFAENKGSGGAIFVDGENCLIAQGRFENCTATYYGGAIFVNKANATIENCDFRNCHATKAGGGAIGFNDKEGRVNECCFYDNSCVNMTKIPTAQKCYGDDVEGYCKGNSDPNTIVQNCTSNSKRDDNYYQCIVNPENVPVSGGSNIYEIFGTDFGDSYSRPVISNYAQNAITNNKQCDVIRPDMKDIVVSDNGHFTLEGKNSYGALWKVDYQNALTIRAKEGYTINRIEGVVTSKQNYEELKVDKGTKKDLIDNPSYFGDWIARNFIAGFDDINSDSVTLSTSGDNTNNNAVQFSEFIVYYTQDTTLGSVFSGGTLWIIIGVLVVAIAAAVVIVVVKKKNKPLAANNAQIEKTDN